jgi:adenylate kinase
VNFGDVMLEEALARGLVTDRDDLATYPGERSDCSSAVPASSSPNAPATARLS